jgi:hypothetical protein
VTLRRHPQALVATVFALATVASLGPHVLMLGYQATGSRPPAELLLLCPLHRLEPARAPALTVHAKPLT